MKRVGPSLLLALLLVAALLGLRGADPALLTALRGAGFDTLQRLWPRQNDPPQPVRVVDIDEASLKAIGQWPWPRDTLARLVDNLNQLGAAAIAFDIVFPEADRMSPRQVARQPAFRAAMPQATLDALPDNDQTFAAALAGKPVVTAFASTSGPPPAQAPVKAGFAQTGANATDAPPRLGPMTNNLPAIDAAAAGIGGINLDLAGEQGVARQVPMLWTDGHRFYPSLAVEALRVAQGADTFVVRADPDVENAISSLRAGDIEIPLSESGMFQVYYRHNTPDLYVSAADILNMQDAERLRPLIEGHVVFIGTSAVGLLDVRTNALGESVPGVSIHAQAAEQMLSGTFLTRPEWAVGGELVAFALLALAVAIVAAVFPPWTALAFASLCTALLVGLVVYAFRSLGLLLDATFPVLALAFTTLAATGFRLLVTDRDGRAMRRMFGHYVAPSVLAEIERNPQSLKLGGEVRDVTVLFVDIANFTPLSEKLKPEELVHTVNTLWEAISTAILAQQGTIDKFIGDAVMAFWNAPVSQPGHQLLAARAALGIREAAARFNANPEIKSLLQQKGIGPVSVRVGLASGPACVGNMGSANRFDYSVLGETVNTAARAESTCKRMGFDLMLAGPVAEETRQLALLPAGTTPMKGKSVPEQVHLILGDEHLRQDKHFTTLMAENTSAMALVAKAATQDALAAARQVLSELALHHPLLASYFIHMADRREDLAPAKAAEPDLQPASA